MSDLTSYRQQVTEYGKRATDAEGGQRYEEAYGYYMQALEVFMHLIKCKYFLSEEAISHFCVNYSREESFPREVVQR